MKITKSKKPRKGRIEIIPMIDIMFFLLATFMLASISMHHFDALPVNLNHGKATPVKDEDKIVLTIDENGRIFVNKKETAPILLGQVLKPLLIDNKTVIIAADKNTRQGVVTESMLVARQMGAQKFSIVVRHK